MPKKKPLVEAAVNDENGRTPLGIMTTKQALDLPEHPDLEFSHPADEARKNKRFLDRDGLKKAVEKQ